MAGFKSPLYILGTGTSTTTVSGRSRGPLPLTVGVSTTVTTYGKGHGPLPLRMGIVYAETEPEVPETPTREAKSSYAGIRIKPEFKEPRRDKHLEQILRDDEELLEIITAFVIGNN